EIDEQRVATGLGVSLAAIAAVGRDGEDAGGGSQPQRRLHLDREAIFVTGTIDPDLVADHEHGEERERPEPFSDCAHDVLPVPSTLGTTVTPASNRRAIPA